MLPIFGLHHVCSMFVSQRFSPLCEISTPYDSWHDGFAFYSLRSCSLLATRSIHLTSFSRVNAYRISDVKVLTSLQLQMSAASRRSEKNAKRDPARNTPILMFPYLY